MREVETVQPLASPPTFGRTNPFYRSVDAELEHFVPCTPSACRMLALCNMKTLYLRNVPAEVIERLERLAEREKTSVSSLAVRELTAASRRVDNPDLLGELPDLNVDAAKLVHDIDAERASR
jgi:hypothetical protein